MSEQQGLPLIYTATLIYFNGVLLIKKGNICNFGEEMTTVIGLQLVEGSKLLSKGYILHLIMREWHGSEE